MLTKLSIFNFKSLERQDIELRPLTVLTGLNSTGKSTCFQAILTALYYSSPMASLLMDGMDFTFMTLRNRNVNAKELSIQLTNGEEQIICEMSEDKVKCENPTDMDLEKNVFYLSANRLGFSEIETISPKYKVGIAGEYLFGTFEQEKSNPVSKYLRILSESDTLSSHINYWLSYILGIKFEMQTEKVSPTKVKVVYKSDELSNLSPQDRKSVV